jgi:hypothetical protein
LQKVAMPEYSTCRGIFTPADMEFTTELQFSLSIRVTGTVRKRFN